MESYVQVIFFEDWRNELTTKNAQPVIDLFDAVLE